MTGYRTTESKYKGGAQELYVTYDLPQRTRSGREATYPKVRRVYIAGDVTGWSIGDFKKRSGRETHGVRIDYEQSRSGYTRRAFDVTRGRRQYSVPESDVKRASQRFTQIVEVPNRAHNVRFQGKDLPKPYRSALQDIR